MKDKEFSIQEILKNFSAQKHLKDKLLDIKLESIWKELYKNFASYTTRVLFKNGKLTIWLSSAPLRQELQYNKPKIIIQINESLGEALINELDFR